MDSLVRFAVRIRSQAPLKDIGIRVNKALNCMLTLAQSPELDAPQLETSLLGLRIDLTYWPHLEEGELRTYTLAGRPWRGPLNEWTDMVNLSPFILNVLKEKDSDEWYIPSKEELLAEGGL
ncbi:MAG TPA: hypothetical protein V6D35_06955 [Candidatus Sericytochromatia bacterium]